MSTQQSDNLFAILFGAVLALNFKFWDSDWLRLFLLDWGKMGEGLSGVLNSRIFSAYSLGLMVRNENLVFNTFELSIGIYPYLPDGESGFRLNPINSYRLKIRDFHWQNQKR